MGRSGNPDGGSTKVHLREHLISRMLHNKNVSRRSFRLRLGIKSPQYYHKCMQNPAEHLSVNQLSIVSQVLEIPLLEVLGIVMGKTVASSRKWYDEDPDALPIAAEPRATYGKR